ncbi:GNAT family N-acetyltransferase [Pantanalinema sp. GBBB05]|uniref:GNAT family N-acetyltransferase n=1 Tax=Pantanalinema sp. GBBB05 TaxID=2604139 RepID=UPI001E0E38D4|nr:GNAT family N-acetyltransferase [Pantanalinema sp. GBBB05]
MALPAGYQLRSGSGVQRSLLVQFMQRSYAEVQPGHSYNHLAKTVEQYFSWETPLWWVESVHDKSPEPQEEIQQSLLQPVACLWLGTAIDQGTGERHAHIFLLYVRPAYRRQGLGTALMQHAEDWARARGDRQIGLQVFQTNQPALSLYHHLGYQTQSLWMVKPL